VLHGKGDINENGVGNENVATSLSPCGAKDPLKEGGLINAEVVSNHSNRASGFDSIEYSSLGLVIKAQEEANGPSPIFYVNPSFVDLSQHWAYPSSNSLGPYESGEGCSIDVGSSNVCPDEALAEAAIPCSSIQCQDSNEAMGVAFSVGVSHVHSLSFPASTKVCFEAKKKKRRPIFLNPFSRVLMAEKDCRVKRKRKCGRSSLNAKGSCSHSILLNLRRHLRLPQIHPRV
jgi:hypothetical protein